MNLVDSHLHFWRLARGDYGWLTPALSGLYRDFAPGDIEAELDAHGVSSVIAVQAAPTEAETSYLLGLAERHPRIAGVVGWVDFEAPDVVARIDAMCAAGKGRLKGFRPMVQDIADPAWLLRPQIDAAFEALAARDLTFDALVTPAHLPILRERLLGHPRLRAVLDHAGKPRIAADAFQPWADSIARLAEDTSAFCKLSGLLTEAGQGSSLSELEPYVAHAFACFGPRRVMWGSDWPVSTLRGDYAHWLGMARALTARLAPGHEEEVFASNARGFYRLPPPRA